MEEENRRFVYALLAGVVISGVIFWAAFTHARILEVVTFAIVASVLLYFRYLGPRQWSRIKKHGNKREFLEFRIFLGLAFLFLLVLALLTEFLTK